MLDTDFDPAQYVRVESISLQTLFLARGPFGLPWAQRSYAWGEDQVYRLIGDLLAGYASPDKCYSLGYVSAALSADDGGNTIADGQQRLITLSLLFAELRTRIPEGPVRDVLSRCLLRTDESDTQPVLTLQESIRDVYTQQIAAIAQSADMPRMSNELNPPEQRLILNRDAIADNLDRGGLRTPGELEDFARFCLTRCTMVLQTVDSEEEALKMLATEEETGLPFHSTERTKVTLISTMPRMQQTEAGIIWDRMQAQLDRDRLAELLNHVRILKVGTAWKGSSKTPVETDLAQLFDTRTRGLAFLNEETLPVLDAYLLITSSAQSGTGQDVVASESTLSSSLATLNWLDQSHWHLPAIAWIRSFGITHPQTPGFFGALDKLAWTFRIANQDQKQTSVAFARLAEAIADARTPADVPSLTPPHATVEFAMASLNTHMFYYKSFAVLVLRRLSLLMGADPGARDNITISGEHILPRSPAENSRWRQDFGDKDAAKLYSDRIGNICFLTPQDNDRVGNKDWAIKQPVLAKSNLVLAQEASEYPVWTRETIETRSAKLIGLIRKELGF